MVDLPRIKISLETIKEGVIAGLNAQGYTSTRATYLDYIKTINTNMELLLFAVLIQEGSITFPSSGNYPLYQTVIDTSQMSEVVDFWHEVEGYIDLSPLGENESVKVYYEHKVTKDGNFIVYDVEQYTAPLDNPLLYVHLRPSKYGARLRIEMTSAPSANRTFPFQIFIKKVLRKI